ncbi:MAG: transposase [Synergistaceae bacterium]|nr:transposase [Synergistaceae bacterium]
MRRASGKLKKFSRELSRKRRGSKNHKKARFALARTHRTIANQRRDYHYKLALELVRRHASIFLRQGLKVKDLKSRT